MSEVELAAKKFELLAAGAPLNNVLYGYPSQKRLWGLAASALREQAERSKGCEHCKVLTAEHCTGFLLPSADPDCEADMVTISHCPMCGKQLEVEP